jgi:hypothetical protein
MSRTDREWPTRQDGRKPLDVLAAQEELCQRLRARFLDALEAEAADAPSGGDATKHFSIYSKALDGLIKLQFDLGHLERVTPGRWGPAESGPVGRSLPEFSQAERDRMAYASLTSDMTAPAEVQPGATANPASDDS